MHAGHTSWKTLPGKCVVAAFVLLLLAPLVLAACGSSRTSPEITASPSADAAAVLVVLADHEFQQLEYSEVRAALLNGGFRVIVATPSGDDARSGNVAVRADVRAADASVAEYAAVVFIGGPGIREHFADASLQALARDAAGGGKVVAAICLAPVILARAGVLEGVEATVWEEEQDELKRADARVQDEPVVVDGRVVTGQGPDAAAAFADALLETLR